jgi:hypothetical protein
MDYIYSTGTPELMVIVLTTQNYFTMRQKLIPGTVFFLNEIISHHQLPLNLICISEQPGFGFYEAIFRLFHIQEHNRLYVIIGEGLHLYMCKIFIQYIIIV